MISPNDGGKEWLRFPDGLSLEDVGKHPRENPFWDSHAEMMDMATDVASNNGIISDERINIQDGLSGKSILSKIQGNILPSQKKHQKKSASELKEEEQSGWTTLGNYDDEIRVHARSGPDGRVAFTKEVLARAREKMGKDATHPEPLVDQNDTGGTDTGSTGKATGGLKSIAPIAAVVAIVGAGLLLWR